MTAPVLALVLGAAVLHAGWNTLLRGGADRAWTMLVMTLTLALTCAAALPFIGGPGPAAWRFAFLSALIHIAYNLFLLRTYRRGDFGQTYPIARGSSPVLVTLGAALFAGEHLQPASIAGVLLVSGGIVVLAVRRRQPVLASLPAALATGCCIGAYSVADGLGVRAATVPLAYLAWSEMLGSAMTAAVLLAIPRVRRVRAPPGELLRAAAGGIASLVAYGVVIWAMHVAPMGAVSALRETSVVFAALFGRLFLHETLTRQRVAACVVIACGAAFLG